MSKHQRHSHNAVVCRALASRTSTAWTWRTCWHSCWGGLVTRQSGRRSDSPPTAPLAHRAAADRPKTACPPVIHRHPSDLRSYWRVRAPLYAEVSRTRSIHIGRDDDATLGKAHQLGFRCRNCARNCVQMRSAPKRRGPADRPSGYCAALMSSVMRSMVAWKCASSATSDLTVRLACRTVVWSRPPKYPPISSRL